MPRTKKPAGQAVDRRNGRRAELEPTGTLRLRKFPLPARRGMPFHPETRRAWAALWEDPVAQVLSPVDRPVLLRWADAMDRYLRLLIEADKLPVVSGSTGQDVANPLYAIADRSLSVAQQCEAQLGVGGLNRAKLGLEVTQARRSLHELNRAYARDTGRDDDADPRA